MLEGQQQQQQSQNQNQKEEEQALIDILRHLEDELFQHKGLKTIRSQRLEKGMAFLLFVQESQDTKVSYAVKAQPIVNQHTGKVDESLLAKCKSEVEQLKQLKHPNIAEIHAEFVLDLFHFIQIPFCFGTLQNAVNENDMKQISDQQFFELADQLLNGVEYLHNNSFTLKELSVNTILIGKEYSIKLFDFLYFNQNEIDQHHTHNTMISTSQSMKKVSFDLPGDSDIEDLQTFQCKKTNDIVNIGICLAIFGGCPPKYINSNNLLNSSKQSIQIPKSPNLSLQANKLIEYILTQNSQKTRPSIASIKEKVQDLYQSQGLQLQTTKRTISSFTELSHVGENGFSMHSSLQKFHNTSEGEQLMAFVSTDRQLLQSIERQTEFNFLKGKHLLRKYKDLIKSNQTNVDALITLGYLEVKINCNVDQSQKYFEKALENNPNEVDAYYGMCECIMAVRDTKNYNKIRTYTQLCLKVKNKDWRADYYNAWVDYEEKEFVMSEKTIDLALQKEKQQPLIYSLKCLIVLETSDNEKRAKTLIGYADSLNLKNDPTIHQRRGIYYLRQNDHTQALHSFQQSLQICPNQLYTNIKLIEVYTFKNMLQKRNVLLEKLQQIFPKNYMIYQILGDIEQYEVKKIIYYQKSIDCNPEQLYSYEQIAQLKQKINQIQDSLLYFQVIIEKFPNNTQALYKCAQIHHYQLKDYESAKQFYLRAIEVDKENCNIWLDISKLYEQMGDFDQSYESIKRIQEINKNDQRIYKKFAFLYLMKENFIFSDFSKKLSKAIKQDPSIELTQEDLQLIEEKQQLQQLEEFLENLIEASSRKSTIYYLLSLVKIYKNNHKDAVNLLRLALQISPQEIKYNILIARCYNILNMQEISLYHYQQILKLDEKNSESLFEMGKAEYKLKNYEECIDFLIKVESIESNQVFIYFMLGDSYLNKGNLNESLDMFRKYIFRCPFNEVNQEVYRLLGKVYEQLGQRKEAIEQCYLYLKTNPENKEVLNTLGNLEYKSNNFKKAIIHLEKALQLDQEMHQCKLMLGIIYKELKEYEKSYNYIEKYLQTFSESVEARLILAQLQFIYKKNILSAIKQYETILEQEPNNKEALLDISNLYEKNNQFEYSQEYIQKYVKFYPTDENGLILIAKMNLKSKNYYEAYLSFQRVIQVNPQNFMAYTNLGEICKYLKKYDESEKYYEKSLEINHRYSMGYYEIAYLNYISTNKIIDYEKIILYMKSAIQLDSDNLSFFAFFGQVYINKKSLINDDTIQYFTSCCQKCKSQHTIDEIQKIIKQMQQINSKLSKSDKRKSTYLAVSQTQIQFSSQNEQQQTLPSQQNEQLQQTIPINQQFQSKKKYCNCTIF